MSIQKNKSHNLPPLQRRIILHLSETSPQTINEIARNISSEYKSTWRSFNRLKEKGFIEKTTVKKYHSREYPQFWLTEKGVIEALIEDVPSDVLFEKTKEIYPMNYILQCLLEIAPKLNLEMFKVGQSAIRTKGKVEVIDLPKMLFYGLQTDLTIETYSEILEILKKYPTIYELMKEQIERMSNVLDKLKEIV